LHLRFFAREIDEIQEEMKVHRIEIVMGFYRKDIANNDAFQQTHCHKYSDSFRITLEYYSASGLFLGAIGFAL
jgi:hypothetical protein